MFDFRISALSTALPVKNQGQTIGQWKNAERITVYYCMWPIYKHRHEQTRRFGWKITNRKCAYTNFILKRFFQRCSQIKRSYRSSNTGRQNRRTNGRTSERKKSVRCSANLLSSIGNNFLILSYSPFSLFRLARAASADRSFRNFANLKFFSHFRSSFRPRENLNRDFNREFNPLTYNSERDFLSPPFIHRG